MPEINLQNTNKKQASLSGLIVAHNEEVMIEDALKSLSFCDEIVVCLDRCTDGTEKIVRKYTDKVIIGGAEDGWESEGVRRMAGIESCNGKWIFELDADERVSPQLAEEVTATVQADEKTTSASYLIPIDNYLGKRLIKYGWAGSFGTTQTVRLFRKGSKTWGNQRVHPKVTFTGEKGALTKPIVHLVDEDISDMVNRLQRYSTSMAQDLVTSDKPLPPFWKVVRKSITRFYKSFLVRKGYKEGRYGFLIASMAGMFMLLAHLKAYEIKEGEK